jgi:hypothetical protein
MSKSFLNCIAHIILLKKGASMIRYVSFKRIKTRNRVSQNTVGIIAWLSSESGRFRSKPEHPRHL